jgi:hypothetical protein
MVVSPCTKIPALALAAHGNPTLVTLPRSPVRQGDVEAGLPGRPSMEWLLGLRDITGTEK